LLLFVVLVWAYPACAVVREGAVPGRSGLSFNNLTYRFNHLLVNIKNGTANNVIFGGTMVFLDRHYKPIARAELLPQHIKRRSTRKYRAVFVEGSGHEAAAAASLIWELDQRNN
jgi:hypothetical protein